MSSPTETPASTRRPLYRELGTSGTRIYGGRITEYELNTDLQGQAWAEAADQMLRTDAVIAAFARTLLDTQTTAEAQFVVEDDWPGEAHRARDFLSEAFGMSREGRGYLRGGWKGMLRHFLRYQLEGFRYFEEVYTPDAGRVWIDFRDREPRAHWYWNMSADGRALESVTQDWTTVGAGGEPIPAHKLALFTHQRTGDNFEGVGMLRPLHFASKLKAHALRQVGIGLERWATPTPKIRTDKRVLEDAELTPDQITALTTEVEQAAERYVAGEASYVKDLPGMDLGTFGERVLDVQQPLEIITACNREFMFGFGLEFLGQGVIGPGGRAAGEVQISSFREMAVAGLDHVADVLGGDDGPGQGTIARLLRWNFPTLDPRFRPRLSFGRLDPGPILALAAELPALIGCGVFTATNEIEDMIRVGMGASPLDPDHYRTPSERSAGGSPAGAAAQLFAQARRRQA